MKLAMLSASFYPRTGGVERHVGRVGAALVEQGHEVRLLTRRLDDMAVEETVDGIAVYRLPARPTRLERDAARAFLAGADVVHSHDAYPLLKWLRLLPRAPRFITWHGYEGWPIPLEAKVMRRLAGLFVGGSICMGEFICRWYGHGCDVVSYGAVDPPAAVTDPPADGPAVWVGRLEPDTGILPSIEALGLLERNHGLRLPLSVCGDGSLRHQAEQLAAKKGVEATFHGMVSPVTPYLEEATLVICTGYLGILEALAGRRAVFSVYDNPLKRDYLSLHPCAGRGLAVAGTPLEMAGQLAAYLAAPESAGLAWGEQFARQQTWPAIAQMYLDLYRGKGVKA